MTVKFPRDLLEDIFPEPVWHTITKMKPYSRGFLLNFFSVGSRTHENLKLSMKDAPMPQMVEWERGIAAGKAFIEQWVE